MIRFMLVCFVFLGWAFWELSGGSDFEPSVAARTPDPIAETELDETPVEEVVTRNLTTPVLSSVSAPIANDGVATIVQTAAESEEIKPTLAVAADTPVVQEAAAERRIDIREISGDRVNMRNGPGTNYGIVSKLTRGTEVEVLQEPGNGWLKLRVVEAGKIGWIADWLVTAEAS